MNTAKYLNEIAASSTHSIMEREMAGLLECDADGDVINRAEAAQKHSEKMGITVDESKQYADMVAGGVLDSAWFESEK